MSSYLIRHSPFYHSFWFWFFNTSRVQPTLASFYFFHIIYFSHLVAFSLFISSFLGTILFFLLHFLLLLVGLDSFFLILVVVGSGFADLRFGPSFVVSYVICAAIPVLRQKYNLWTLENNGSIVLSSFKSAAYACTCWLVNAKSLSFFIFAGVATVNLDGHMKDSVFQFPIDDITLS